jgi:hypothetical protein
MANSFWAQLASAQGSVGSSSYDGYSGAGSGYGATNPGGSGIGSGGYNPYDIRAIYQQLGIPGFAKGGTLIARKPTLAVFGEAGAERADFTPLNKGGASSNGASGGGMGGQLSLRIALSEGLVAEIIESSLENTAAHIEHVRRVS